MIGELKSLLLTALGTGLPFYFKFHCYNWEKMSVLYQKQFDWNAKYDPEKNKGEVEIDIYHDLENYELIVESEDGSQWFIIEDVNDQTKCLDLFDKFKKAYKAKSGLDYNPVVSQLGFHLEDDVGIFPSDASLHIKKFSDLGINRFSKLTYHNDDKHDKAGFDQFKNEFHLEIQY